MINDIIDWKILLSYEPEIASFQNVTFKKDFGPWKKGTYFDIVSFDLETGLIQMFGNDGRVISSGKIGL